ncbi:MAG: alpha/beta hydrolase [Blastocatellia bacterium]|nr:alpha/beta hydrolase [Blastocatellia bacterium]
MPGSSLFTQALTQVTDVPAGVVTYRNLCYVPSGHERHKLDLYLPPGGAKLPLIIWISGGAWRTAEKERGVPFEVLAKSYALASINHRLSQHAKFPAQIEDCKAAVRWLRANAESFGLDPSRFGVWGASSGGHLAALLGVTGGTREFDVGEHLHISSRVQVAVDFYGPTDFLQMDAHRLPESTLMHDSPDSPESELIGGPIQEHIEQTQRANPIHYVTADASPFLIVHGDLDLLVPHHQSELLVAALRQAGVPVSFYTVQHGGHGKFADPKANRLPLEFFAAYLNPGGSLL